MAVILFYQRRHRIVRLGIGLNGDDSRQALAFQDAGQILQALIYGFNGGTEGVILQKRRFHKPRRKLVYEIDNTLCARGGAGGFLLPLSRQYTTFCYTRLFMP